MNDDEALHITTAQPPPPGATLGVDRNGCPTQRRRVGDAEVVVHFDDIPERDRTEVDGIPVTTVPRTIIDVASELDAAELDEMIQVAIARGLCTVEEVFARASDDDLASRPGAGMVRGALRRLRLVAD